MGSNGKKLQIIEPPTRMRELHIVASRMIDHGPFWNGTPPAPTPETITEDVGSAIDAAIALARQLPPTRPLANTITRLEEAQMWLRYHRENEDAQRQDGG